MQKEDMKMNMMLFLIYLTNLAFLLIIGLSMLALNVIIFIINGIIILNVLFVIGYYLYILFKNPIFWKKYINFFIVLIVGLFILSIIFICLSIFATDVYAATPEPDTEAFFETLRNFKIDLAAKKVNFFNQKTEFDKKASYLIQSFNNSIDYVEYKKSIATSQFKPLSPYLAHNESLENDCMKFWNSESRRIRIEAGSMLEKVSELEAIDAKIHSLTQTNFDNKEYQKLTHYFLQFRTGDNWIGTKHPNKIILDMNLKNRFF